MEDSIKGSLAGIQKQKETFRDLQLDTGQNSNQSQTGIYIPFCVSDGQQLQPQSWMTNNDAHRVILQEETNFATQRDVEYSSGSNFGGFLHHLDSYNKTQVLASGKPDDGINTFCGNAPMGLQLSGQNQYMSYNVDVLDDKRFHPSADMNQHGSSIGFALGKCEPADGSSIGFALGKCEPADMNQHGSSIGFALGKCEPAAVGHDNTNNLLQETSMDSIFEHLQCQKASRVPSPLLPSIYKRVARDPSQILCEMLNAPN